MHNRSSISRSNALDESGVIFSRWSPEDDAFLAEVEGVPGTLAEGRTEGEARDAAIALAETWSRIEEQQDQLTLDAFVAWMGLDQHAAERIRKSESVSHQSQRRSLSAWNKALASLDLE